MGKRNVLIMGLVAILIVFVFVSAWAVPKEINYQGHLTDVASGDPITDTLSMTFKLYNAASGGILRWEETQSAVDVQGGIYNVVLGSVTPLPENIFSEGLWLEVWIGMEQLSPRQKLTSMAYAFQAGNAQMLEGHGSADFSPAVHQHSGADITSGMVNETRIDESIARDSEITWGNLSGIPPDIADGDDDSGGDITGVTAGAGLSGGGKSGTVSLNVAFAGSGSATTVSRSDHDHWGESWSESGVGLILNSSSNDALRVSGANDGVYVQSAGDDGVTVFSAGDDGVFVRLAGSPSSVLFSTLKNGFEVGGTEGNGLYVGQADQDGVSVESAGSPSSTSNSTLKNGFEVAGAEGNG